MDILNTPQHIDRFQMAVYKQGIKALIIGMQINRGFTAKNCKAYVSKHTGKKYPTGKEGLNLALNDIEKMLAVATY